jgi:hypothetical protein
LKLSYFNTFDLIQQEATMLKLTGGTIEWLKNTADQLKGSARRLFMAETVQQLGYGGANAAQEKLNWNRGTIRNRPGRIEKQPCRGYISRQRP